MAEAKRVKEDAYTAFLLGLLYREFAGIAINGETKIKIMSDLEGNPSHLELDLIGVGIKLQVLVKPIPEEPGVTANI